MSNETSEPPPPEIHVPSVKVTFAVGAESPKESRRHGTSSTTTTSVFIGNDDEDDDSVDSMHFAPPRPSSPLPGGRERLHPQVHEMFVELFDLKQYGTDKGLEWRETARWMKYEEDVEGVDFHWGRPHVAFLPFHALLQLRKCLQQGVVLLDLNATSFDEISRHIALQLAKPMKGGAAAATGAAGAKLKPNAAVSLSPADSHVMSPVETIILNTLTLIAMRHVVDTPLRRMTSKIRLDGEDRKHSFFGRKLSKRSRASFLHAQHHLRSDTGHGSSAHEVSDDQKQRSSFLRKLSTPFRSTSSNATKASNASVKNDGMLSATSQQPAGGEGASPKAGDDARARTRSTTSFINSFANFTEFIEKEHILNRLEDDTEAAQVFTGVVEGLKTPRFAMVRLAEALFLPDMIEAPVPIRFLFVILGPQLDDMNYHEVGRAIATLMSDRFFHSIAYRATEKNALLAAMDTFLDMSVVIPPGEIDHKRLINADEIRKVLRQRKRLAKADEMLQNDGDGDGKKAADGAPVDGGGDRKQRDDAGAPRSPTPSSGDVDNPLVRTNRLFHGLGRDICSRLPYYWSDIADAFNFRCLTAIVFMFFASFAPAITFGGLMGSYTNDAMGTTETLLAQCLCGLAWGLFAAQPLLIMSATGPVLIFEASLYAFCQHLDLDFLTVRVWAGAWLLLLAVVTVALEGVVLVRYVSRFTEDIFAALISIIFIAESLKFVAKTFAQNPLGSLSEYISRADACMLANTSGSLYAVLANASTTNMTQRLEHCTHTNQPDTGLLTAILVVATFALAYAFRTIRTSVYLSREMRNIIGDFGVALAIGIVSIIYNAVFKSAYLQVLDMPETFGFTSPSSRKYRILIDPVLAPDKWWGYAFAFLPAFLVFILLFVETEITELLLSKKDKGLRKGRGGFHWDLLLVGALAFVCSLLGLPWMCAAAVQSLAHVGALTVWHRHVPGERPKVDHVVEQRVTTVGVAVLVGACAFGGAYLRVLPLAVLFGVFLYLGMMNLGGVQLVKRIVLLFIPRKHFPDHAYCQKVSTARMHVYTALQLTCLAVVYLVKHFKTTALAFPFVLSLIALLRRLGVTHIFTAQELQALDGHDEESDEDEEDNLEYFGRINVY